jgi:hypothetical protein
MAFALRRGVVTLMSSNVGSWSIFGRTGLRKTLMISSTVSALICAMVVVVFVCEGRELLDGNKVIKLTRTYDLH